MPNRLYAPTRQLNIQSGHTDIHIPRLKLPESPESRHALSTRFEWPLAHYIFRVRDITTPRPKRSEHFKMRYALSNHLFAPTSQLYIQSIHTNIDTQRPKHPEIRHAKSIRFDVPFRPLNIKSDYSDNISSSIFMRPLTYFIFIPHVSNVPRLDKPYSSLYMRQYVHYILKVLAQIT